MHKIRIFVVDDQGHARRGIINYLESCINEDYKFEIIPPNITIDYKSASKGFEDLLELVRKYEPDVMIMDIDWGQHGHTSGIDASRLIHEKYPKTGVIMFSYLENQEVVRRAVQEGKVEGYITKDGNNIETFPEAITKVYRGEKYFSQDIMSLLVEIVQTHNLLDLNDRERKVLEYMARGWSNSKIAKELHFTEPHIRKTVSDIYVKLVYSEKEESKNDIEPRVMAIRKGFELGYLDKYRDLP